MPGPSNSNKKKKINAKKQKKRAAAEAKPVTVVIVAERLSPAPSSIPQAQQQASSCGSSSPSSPLLTPPPLLFYEPEYVYKEITIPEIDSDHIEQVLVKPPFIHDPGNGPRVRDTRAFLESKFFAQPPALDKPLCAEFAQDEVLQMLRTVLPDETATILWYNKSRATSRICPACQRLYRLGDVLPDHMEDEMESARPRHPPPPQLWREQEISGLCSALCFILASFNFASAIKSAWGHMADEIDDQAWELLNGPGEGKAQGDVGRSLGMVVRMTRLDDLGLAQLCFSPQDEKYLMDDASNSGEPLAPLAASDA